MPRRTPSCGSCSPDEPEFVENYFRFVAEDVREHMARLGFRTMDEMIGRGDRLETRAAIEHWKAKDLDLSGFFTARASADAPRRRTRQQQHGLDEALDATILPLVSAALEGREPVELHLPIRNVHRSVGTRLGYEVTSRMADPGCPAARSVCISPDRRGRVLERFSRAASR